MSKLDDLIARLEDPYRRLVLSDRQEAAEAIRKLISDIRCYNPDDELFDDERRPTTQQSV